MEQAVEAHLHRAERPEHLGKAQRAHAREARGELLDEAGDHDDHVEPVPAGAQVGVLVADEPERRHLHHQLEGEELRGRSGGEERARAHGAADEQAQMCRPRAHALPNAPGCLCAGPGSAHAARAALAAERRTSRKEKSIH